ncbi:MAG: hypothetical protein II949_07655 [Prevotella sp.]|nr:hypothetical protein [Prevotella sp.]
MNRTTTFKVRAALMLLVSMLTTATSAGAADVIDLTFAGRGDATTVESVTVTNLTHPDIAPVTLSGSATLRLIDMAAAMRKGDVNVDSQVGIGDIVAITNVMAGTDTDTGLKTRSDVNGDGTVGIGDIVAITNLMAGNFGFNNAGGNAVTMQFNAGDILRFEGTSGRMRTIMHLSPESSHPVTLDFFRCQDASGYNYPIVRIGDMLWMMEDLRPQTMPNLTTTEKVNLWKKVGATDSAVFVSNERGYYNVPGARKAMPAGWEMPSIDEMYALVKEMEVDTLLWGDFLKDRTGYKWDKALIEGPDSVHLQLLPNGYIDATGELTDEEVMGAWLTRNTMRHGCPVTFEINALNSQLYPMVIHEKGCGFTVRGCRPAPSVYTEMLEQQKFLETENTSARHKIPMQLVNDNGPLGAYYTFGADRKSIFFDYSFTLNTKYDGSTACTKRSGILYRNTAGTWTGENKQFVPLDVNGADYQHHLRKVAPQGNADGYENVVYASWSLPFQALYPYSATPTVAGEGVVRISIFGDSIRNHAMLNDYRLTLLDSSGNEYKWEMPFVGVWSRRRPGYEDNNCYLSDIRYEYYARAFNLNCIQDQTGDGVEEIVMNVGDKIAVFDGASMKCLRERRISSTRTFTGSAHMRFDVADVNGDGYEDIVLLVDEELTGGHLYIYDKGHLDEKPIFTKPIFYPLTFCDVKVGNMSGFELPDIALLMRGTISESEEELKKQGTLIVFRLAYNSDMELEESHPNVQTVDCFYAASHRKWVLGNMTLCFGYFRGRDVKDLDGNTVSYPQDLVVGCNLYRWDEQEAKPVCLTSILQSDRYTVPADAIMAVQTKKGDKESLVYFEHDHLFCSSSWPRSNSKLCERWLDTDGKTVKSKSDFGSSIFGWTDSQMTRFLNMETNQETNAHPVLCKFADRERPMKFKFKSHELNFSEPRIYAVIAAPPYYKDLGPGGATTWGKSSTTSNSTATSDEWGGSVIAGYEHSYSVPFFSSAEVGVEFTTKVSVAGGIATEHEVTMGSGQEYSVSEEHSVVMQATPFDTYRYEIIDSADPDEEGMEFVVSMPRERTFKLMTLPTYVRLMASQKNVARPQRFLTSTPGNPWSYPMNYDNEIKFVDDAHPFLKGKDMNQGYTNESVPDGIGNSATRSLSMATSDSKTKSVSLEVETELVATVGGAKAGVGFNYGHTKENTHTIGQEFSVGGTVSGIPYNDPDHPEFKWNVVWYYVKDAGGIYPVVNYIVTR